MSERRRRWSPFKKPVAVKAELTPTAIGARKASPTEVFGGISDVLKSTDDLTKSSRSRSTYDNYDQTLVVRTTNQEWVDSTMMPKYQYSILKFYRSN